MNPKDLVLTAVSEMTVDLDLDAVDRYFSPAFIQHSPTCPQGVVGLKTLIEHAKRLGVRYKVHRALADGQFVVLHSRAVGLDDLPMIIFDIYRVHEDKIVEHWEAMQPELADGMIDGPTKLTDLDRTDENREVVRNAIEKVFIGGDVRSMESFFDFETDQLYQHNSVVPDGASALRRELNRLVQEGGSVEYVKLHRIIAEGNFAFTQCEAAMGGRPHAFYELFRVERGKIVEHWDVHPVLTDFPPHPHGLF